MHGKLDDRDDILGQKRGEQINAAWVRSMSIPIQGLIDQVVQKSIKCTQTGLAYVLGLACCP